MELDFNKILDGHDQTSEGKQTAKKLTQTETRARQQSCMITDIDKSLVPLIFHHSCRKTPSKSSLTIFE
jgi:hypothetical protein